MYYISKMNRKNHPSGSFFVTFRAINCLSSKTLNNTEEKPHGPKTQTKT